LAEGYIYKDSGEVNKAVQSFEKVIALDAKNNQAYLALAWLYKDRGYLDKAYEYGVQALALSPQPKECEALFESMNNNTGYDLTKNIRVGEASEFQKIPEAIEYKVYDATRAQVLAGLTGTQPAPAPRPGLLTYFNNSLQTSFAYENLPIMHFGYTNTSFLDNKDQGLPGYNHMMIHAFDFSAQELLSREKFIWDTSLSLGYNRTFCRNPDNAPLYNEDKNIYYFAFKTEPVFRQFDIYGGVNYLNNTSIYSADYNQWDGRLEFRHSFKTLGASLNYGLDLTNAQYTSSIYKTRQDYFIAGYLPVLSPLATFSRLEAIINQGHELDDATSFLVSTHTYQFTEELHYPLLEPLILVPRGVLEWGSETHAYDNYLLGMELRYFLKTSSRREVAEKTVSWRETITATLGFKYDRYNQINWSYNQLYFRIYFFL
jgi:tetratricopeptide (TPR) repeat protein